MRLGLCAFALPQRRRFLRPIFDAPLTRSLVPGYAAGSPTPTFFRASAAYVQDHEGVLRQVIANEARFWGARRARNLVPTSETLNNVLWATAATANKTLPLTVNFPANNDAIDAQSSYNAANRVFAFRFTATGNGTLRIGLSNGVDNVVIWGTVTLTETPTEFTGTFAAQNATVGGAALSFRRDNGAGTTCTQMTFIRVAFYDVTGESAQTAPEYVSVGVLSSPWQGANADGVQYFDTVRLHTQNTVRSSEGMSGGNWSRSNCTIGATNIVDSAGAATAVKQQVNDTSNTQKVLFGASQVTFPAGTLIAGSLDIQKADSDYHAIYLVSSDFSSSISARYRFSTDVLDSLASSGAAVAGTISRTLLSNGWVRLTLTGHFVAANAPYLYSTLSDNGGAFGPFVGTVGFGTNVSRAQIRLATPSVLSTYVPTTTAAVGPTDTGTTAPIPATTALGYLAEEQRTNICPNNMLSNGVAGSPGTVPTSWDVSTTMTGVTRTLSFGIDSGVPYMDVRYNGTNGTAGARVDINSAVSGLVAATANQVWNGSMYLRLVAGAFPGGVTHGQFSDMFLTGAYVTTLSFANATPAATGALSANRISGNLTIPASGVNQIGCIYYNISSIPAAAVDFTVRVALPQTEQGAGATTPIPTSTGATTRPGDALSYPALSNFTPSAGAAYCEFTTGAAILANTYHLYPSMPVLAIGGGLSTFSYDNVTFAGSGVACVPNTSYRQAAAWGGSTFSNVRNGAVSLGLSKAFAGTLGSAAGSLPVNQSGASQFQTNGTVRNLRLYSQKLTDAQLTAMVA